MVQHVIGKSTVQGGKHIIWDALISKATKLRPYLDYILDKEMVIQESKQSVTIVKEKLNKKPVDYAKDNIEFLNGMTEEEIRKAGIRDKVYVIT